MKHSLFLTALLAGTMAAAAPALSADDFPPEFRSSTFEIYIGAFGSGDLVQSTYGETIAGATEEDLEGSAAGYGVRGGVDYVLDGWVLGVVGDWSFGFDQQIAEDDTYPADLTMPYLATLRARAGYTAGPALFYITGGYAQAEMELNVKGDGEDTPKGSDSDWSAGWVLGAGVDYALIDRVTIGLEYLFVSLDDFSYTIGTEIEPAEFRQDLEAIHTIRLGVNYAFPI